MRKTDNLKRGVVYKTSYALYSRGSTWDNQETSETRTFCAWCHQDVHPEVHSCPQEDLVQLVCVKCRNKETLSKIKNNVTK